MATITKDMSIGQVLSLDRSTASIFISQGMHCLGCPHATAESLQDACAVHGADVDALVEKLNAHVEAKA